MTNIKKPTSSSSNRAVWLTGILCVACCTIPLVGIVMGSATLAAFAFYAEGIAIAMLALGTAWFGYKYISRRKAAACDVDCGCRPVASKDDNPKTD